LRAVVHDFHAPLTIEQVPFSPLGPDQIRVQIEACGLCHTDIHAAHGDWPVKPAPPFTPGHLRQVNEAIADVEAGRVVARVVLQP
jgi:propanol-preferring alcohol dehydrogenase